MTDDALKSILQAFWSKEALRVFNEYHAAARVADRIESCEPLYYGTLRPMSFDAPIKTAEEEKPMGELSEKLSDQDLIKKARDAAVAWAEGSGSSNLGPLLVRLVDALEAAEAREKEAAALIASQAELLAWAMDAADGIRIYGSDALSNQVDGPDDGARLRKAVMEMTRQARVISNEIAQMVEKEA